MRLLCISFSSTDSGLSIYRFSAWPNINLHNSQWITFLIQSCLLLHFFCASNKLYLIISILTGIFGYQHIHLKYGYRLYFLHGAYIFCTEYRSQQSIVMRVIMIRLNSTLLLVSIYLSIYLSISYFISKPLTKWNWCYTFKTLPNWGEKFSSEISLIN